MKKYQSKNKHCNCGKLSGIRIKVMNKEELKQRGVIND